MGTLIIRNLVTLGILFDFRTLGYYHLGPIVFIFVEHGSVPIDRLNRKCVGVLKRLDISLHA